MENSPIQIGEWLVDVESHQMQRLDDATQQVIFEPKVMNVLACLIEHAGQVVSSEVLLDRCWPNQFLSDNPLHKCITQLRKAFKDSSRNPTYIQTIPKRGYRLIAQISSEPDNNQITDIDIIPYPGTRSFAYSESRLFYGRDYAVQELLYIMKQPATSFTKNCVLVVGESLVGKTSLIHAGLRPELEQQEIEFQYIDAISSQSDYDQQLKALEAITRIEDDKGGKVSKPTVILFDHIELAVMLREEQQEHAHDVSDFKNRVKQLLDLALKLYANPNVKLLICLNPFNLGLLKKFSAYQSIVDNAHLYTVNRPASTDVYLAITQPAINSGYTFKTCPKTGKTLAQELHKLYVKNQLTLKQLQGLLLELCQRSPDKQLSFDIYNQIKRERTDLWMNRQSHIRNEINTNTKALDPLLAILIKVNFDGAFHIKLTEIQLDTIQNNEMLRLVGELISNDLLSCYIKNNESYIRFISQSVIHALPFTQQWINKHYQSLITKEHISANCELWKTHNQSSGYLLSPGKPLEDARQLMELKGKELAQPHKDYIRASLKAEKRKNRIKSIMVAAVCILSLTSTSALLVANNARISQQNARNNAEQLIAFMNQELKRELIPLGKLDLMESLGIEIINYFNSSGIDSSSAQLHNAMAQRLLGEVYTQQGHHDKANHFFEQATSLLNTLVESQLESSSLYNDIIYELGQVSYWQGYLSYLNNDYSQTRHYWEAYFNHSTQLIVLSPENSRYLNELSYAHNNLGTLELLEHEYQDALHHFEQSAELKQRLLKESNLDITTELVDTYSWIARTYDYLGETHKSRAQYQKQLETLLALKQQQDINKAQQYYLAVAYQNLANLNFVLNDIQPSLAQLNSSLLLLDELISYEPTNVEYQESKVFTLIMQGQLYRIQGQYDLAQLQLNKALTLNQSLQPETIGHASQKAEFYQSKIYYELGRYHQAQGYIKSADDYYQKALTQNIQKSGDSYHQELFALLHLRTAELKMAQKRDQTITDSIRSELQMAEQIFEQLTKNNRSLRYQLPFCQIKHYLKKQAVNKCSTTEGGTLSVLDTHPEYNNLFETPIAN